jgi:kynurenine formamidase
MPGSPPDGPVPPYDQLPAAGNGGRTAWGLWGPDESVGRLHLQAPERVASAARLVRRGAVFALDAALGAVDPPLTSARGVPRHRVLHEPGPGLVATDDVWDNLYPQAGSQWDSLAHIAYQPGAFYNGATDDDILSGRRNTIDHWARRGIAGRGVLLDLPRHLGVAPEDASAYTVEQLEEVRRAEGVEYSEGCVILLRTGFLGWYTGLGRQERLRARSPLRAPGVQHTEAMARYLWDSGAAAVAADTYAVEVWPPDFGDDAAPWGFLHRVLIGALGFALGELWDLDALAADCAADGVYDCFVTSAPLHAPGGIGSPANALAIK